MNIIIRPVITEKMNAAGEKMNRYGFIVERTANKIEIKAAIKAVYGVEAIAVNTVNYLGKSKSRYTKAGYINGRMQSYKKAIVTLAEGETIDFYSNI
ncbi:MAG: 50S ribosomal protein L23 [Sphingobacteriia bacterium]|nr:50S ribosomal protein L23 [Sphingobacteriia bacterium]HML83575.1 50S ribosomal protein L23 [Bacteroidales bacterium]